MDKTRIRSDGVVIPFPVEAARQARSTVQPREATGEIVLFTGIRYERPPVPAETPRPLFSGGPGRRRRP